ncbi:MAG: ThiF family adenylyltransferase, partial [bacterium]
VLDVLGRPEEIEVSFPAHFPDGCPSVRPVPNRAISSHQYRSSGILCLELGPDNWHPNHSVGDVVHSAWKLLAYETLDAISPIEIPSRHNSDLAAQVAANGVLLRSPTFDERIREATVTTRFNIAWGGRYVLRVVPIEFPDGSRLLDVPPALLRHRDKIAVLVMLRTDAPAEVPSAEAAFRAFVEEHSGEAFPNDARVVVLKWQTGRLQSYFIIDAVLRLADVPLEVDDGGRTPTELTPLATVKVCIVGLGSIGSKVAVSLARLGVTEFVLVDGDLLLGPNIARHAGTFADVGLLKTEVVQELVRDVSHTEPKITTYGLNLLSATNPELHAEILDRCAACDVIVDATANPDVFGKLAQISSDFRRPMLWGEVFGGGLGGLIASAQPERTPCARCVRAGFLSETNAWPPAPGRDAAAPYTAEQADPLAAADPHVSLIASAMTMRLCDLVTSAEPFPEVTAFGFRRRWIFESPPQTVHVRVRRDDFSCPRCWVADGEPELALAAKAEAIFVPPDDAHPETPA